MRPFLIAVFVGLAAVPLFVFAQGLVPCSGPDCQACDLVKLGNNVISFLISIAAIIGAIMFAVAGFKMVISAGNESEVSAAKELMTNVVIGFVILLAAWLIVDTVMKTFVGDKLGRPWQTIQCVDQPIYTQVREGNAGGGAFDPTADEGLSDSVARSSLEANGVTVVSSGQCTDASNSSCTSLAGMRQDTIDQIIAIQQACGNSCNVVVTGGTEAGHAAGSTSHANGYKVDIDDGNGALNTYLESTLVSSGTRGGTYSGARYLDSCGNEYVRENTHWDITVTQQCSL